MPYRTLFKTVSVAQTLGLILSVAFTAFGQTPKTDETRELPPAQTLERQMMGAETHRYKISLKKDEFFQVRVEQKGVDVAVKIVDASGRTLATMDSPNGTEGAEVLSFVAETADSYLLEVSGLDAKAEQGNYTIQREASRTATADDRKRVAVEWLFVEGMTARDVKGQSETALAKLEEALRGWQELKDDYLIKLTAQEIKSLKHLSKKAQADVLYDEAIAFSKQGTKESLQNAAANFSEALRVYVELEDIPDEAITLNQLGYLYGVLGETQNSLEYFNKSLPLYKAVGDKHGEANTLDNIGGIYGILGETQKALEYYNQSLPLIRSIADKTDSDKRLEARTLYDTAALYINLSETQKALEYLTLALSLCREIGYKVGEATTLNNFGGVYSGLGEKQKAFDYYTQALALIRTVTAEPLDSKGLEATTLNNIGGVYADLGEPQKALDYYKQSLPLSKTIGDKHGEANTLNSVGYVYSNLGERQKALDYYTQALVLMREVGDHREEASILANMGVIYSTLGEKQKALENYNQALLLQKAAGDRSGEAATLTNISKVYEDFGEKQKALEYLNQALSLAKAIGDKRTEAKILNGIGKVYWELGENQKALEYYNQDLPLIKVTGDRREEANVLNNIGVVYWKLGEKQKSIEYFNKVLPISKAVGNRSGEAVTLSNMMVDWESLNNRRLAILYGKQSINILQSLRADIKGLDRELQQSFLGTIEDTYRGLVELLIKEGRIPEGERVLRMLKEEEYFQFVRRDGRVVASLDERINLNPTEKKAIEQYETIALEISRIYHETEELEKEASTSPGQNNISARQTELSNKLELSWSKLKSFLVQLSTDFAKKEADSNNAEESSQAIVKEWNDPHVAVISTIVGANNLSVIVTTAEFQRGYVIPVSEEELNKLVGNFRAAIVGREDVKPAAQELYNVLFKPIEKDLESVKARTLIWSLDKFLRYVPVSALWDKDRGYLVQDYASVILALASRQSLAFRPANKNQWQALGVGVSKSAEGFGPLSYVSEELRAIVRDSSAQPKKREFGMIAGRRLLDEQFTYDSLLQSLGKYPFTHAATHFKFIPGTKAEGLNSFLLLGNGEKLTLAQVQNADNIFAGIELLTLSACDTAYGGKTADGREIEGFGVLAQRKGARAIMATLWPVDDESTRDLMIEFYRDYQKPNFNKAEALRQAQLVLLQEPDKASNGKPTKPVNASPKEFAHPYYWSPFILIGNWQ